LQARVRKMRADETRAARNQNSQMKRYLSAIEDFDWRV
jgi:hypothetical protein